MDKNRAGSAMSYRAAAMDHRVVLRELDELIARARSATERETALLKVLPGCVLRERKQRQVRTMRARLHELRQLRCALTVTRRPRGARLY
jgi:hypothetical protein